LERPDTRICHRFGNGSVHLFNRRHPFGVAGFFSQSNGLPAKKDRVVRLRHKERD
jgi:hypothetical protein